MQSIIDSILVSAYGSYGDEIKTFTANPPKITIKHNNGTENIGVRTLEEFIAIRTLIMNSIHAQTSRAQNIEVEISTDESGNNLYC